MTTRNIRKPAWLSMIVILAMIWTSLPVVVNAGQSTALDQASDITAQEPTGVMGPYLSEPAVPPKKQMYFANYRDCLAALEDGTADFYDPTFYNLYKKPRAGERVIRLESNACVEMLTVRGYRIVAQAEGTEMVFRGKTIDRREDCGNPIRNIWYPEVPPEQPEKPPEKPPEKARECPPGTYPSEAPGICILEKETSKDYPCPPDTWRIVTERGDSQGKLGPRFKVAEVTSGLPADVQQAIQVQVGKEKIRYLLILQGACENERNKIKIVWFDHKGGWHWKEFLIGVGVGFLVGILIPSGGGVNNPVLAPTKTKTHATFPVIGPNVTPTIVPTRRRRVHKP